MLQWENMVALIRLLFLPFILNKLIIFIRVLQSTLMVYFMTNLYLLSESCCFFFFASFFFLTICVCRDNVILAKHVVLYLCRSWLVFQIGNKWRGLRPLVIKEALSKLSCKYIFLNYKDKMSTLLS